jgi:hypothetical protein
VTKYSSTDQEQQGKKVLASVEENQQTGQLQGLGLTTPEDVDSDVGQISSSAPIIAKLLRDLDSSQRKVPVKESMLERDEDTDVGKVFEKQTPLLLADNSDRIPVVTKSDEGGPEGYESLTSARSDDTEPFVIARQINPDFDGATQGVGSAVRSSGSTSPSGSISPFGEPGDDPGNGWDPPDSGDDPGNGSDQPAPIPEPASMILLGTGLVGLFGLRKKLKK